MLTYSLARAMNDLRLSLLEPEVPELILEELWLPYGFEFLLNGTHR
jgi:hypothetical protein